MSQGHAGLKKIELETNSSWRRRLNFVSHEVPKERWGSYSAFTSYPCIEYFILCLVNREARLNLR
ncbi:MAG: hypothetical protein DMG06_06020 [Acidobacteria bacterium]|nr:MAG: hypothetical protein DMG06_06020 [Acidobacteriota bacterium]